MRTKSWARALIVAAIVVAATTFAPLAQETSNG